MARRRDTNYHDPFEPEGGEDSEYPDEGDGAELAADTAFCPECGAEIYDAADVCPKCFSWIDGDTVRRSPRRNRAHRRWTQLVVWALIAAILLGAGALWVIEVTR